MKIQGSLFYLLLVMLSLTPPLGADPVEDQFNFATGLLIKEEYELAAEEFADLLKENPGMAQASEATFRLGECHWKLSKPAAAREAFESVVSDFPKSKQAPQSLYRLGQIHAASTPPQWAQAAKAYAQLADGWPADTLAAAARYWSGESLFKAKQDEAACKALARYLKDYPKGAYVTHAAYTMGWARFRQERFQHAHDIFAAFVRQHPDHDLAPECRLRAADALHKLKKHTAALAAYEPLTVADYAHRREALLGKAWVLYDMERGADAALAFAVAGRAQGTNALAASCFFNSGNAFVQAGNFSKAHAAFDAALQPPFAAHALAPQARYWRGYTLLRLGRFEDAARELAVLDKSGAPAERQADIRFALAEARAGLGQHMDAAKTYAALVAEFADHALAPQAAYAAVLEYDEAGDSAAAARAAGAMVTTFPKHALTPLARFALAEFRFREGGFKQSLAILRGLDTAALTPELQDDYLYKFGWAAFNLKQYDEAASRFGALTGLKPPSPLAAEAAYMQGRVMEAKGEIAKAKPLYQRCITAYAATPFAAKASLALAHIALGARDYPAALKALVALEGAADPAVVSLAALYKGEALLAQDQFADAETAYRVAADGTATRHEGLYGAAWAHYRSGPAAATNAAKAFTLIAADQTSPRAAEAAFWSARAHEDAENFAAAAAAYDHFLKRKDAVAALVPEAQYRQALVTGKGGDRGAAATLYAALAKQKSEFADNALYDAAWLKLEAEELAGAATLFQQLVDQCPTSELLSDARFRLATLSFDAKRYAEALPHLQALATEKELLYADMVLYRLAWALRELDRAEQAAAVFQRLATDFPDRPLAAEARYRAGRAYRKVDRSVEALAMFKAVTQGEFAERAGFQIAEMERAAGQGAAALAAYRATLTQFPEGELVVALTLGLGHCQRDAGAYLDAIESYGKVVALTDTVDAAQALLGRGLARMAMKQHKAAAKDFLKVDILYGYEELKPQALLHLAACYEALGDTEKAAKYRQERQTRYPE